MTSAISNELYKIWVVHIAQDQNFSDEFPMPLLSLKIKPLYSHLLSRHLSRIRISYKK